MCGGNAIWVEIRDVEVDSTSRCRSCTSVVFGAATWTVKDPGTTMMILRQETYALARRRAENVRGKAGYDAASNGGTRINAFIVARSKLDIDLWYIARSQVTRAKQTKQAKSCDQIQLQQIASAFRANKLFQLFKDFRTYIGHGVMGILCVS